MLRRLAKLGITKTDPNDLTAEERSRWGFSRDANSSGHSDARVGCGHSPATSVPVAAA